MRITKHAAYRAVSRCGCRKTKVSKLLEKVMERGITHAEATGSLKKLLDGMFLRHVKANNIRVFANKVYIIAGQTLITVINLPTRFIAEYETCQRIKNMRVETDKAAANGIMFEDASGGLWLYLYCMFLRYKNAVEMYVYENRVCVIGMRGPLLIVDLPGIYAEDYNAALGKAKKRRKAARVSKVITPQTACAV